jgi:hypothetical protein
LAAVGAAVDTELTSLELARGLFGNAGATIGAAGAAVGTLIDADVVHQATPRRCTLAARVVAREPWRAPVPTETAGLGTIGGAVGRVGDAGAAVVITAISIGAAVATHPLLLVTGHF